MKSEVEPQLFKKGRFSLIIKFGLVFFIGFIFTSLIIGINIYTGYELESDAARINLAGQMRYRAYEFHYLVDEYSHSNKVEKSRLKNNILVKVEQYEEIMNALRYGSSRFNVIPTTKESLIESLDSNIEYFKKEVRPLIISSTNSNNQNELSASYFKFGDMLPQFVNNVDKMVYSYQQRSIDRVKWQQLLQYIFISIIIVLGILSAYVLRNWVSRPVFMVVEGLHSIEKGELDKKVNIKSNDELGELANGFNVMAETIMSRTKKMNELADELRQLSITDSLTGVFNHRHFYTLLDNEMERTKRYNRPLSLLFIDVDYFKDYNDINGHLAGDEVLKNIARVIKDNIRTTDYLCRYGGEEFTVILPESEKGEAKLVGEKIRGKVEEEYFPNEEKQPNGKITISIGVSSIPEDTVDLEDLVIKADNSLYEAKARGRNLVIVT